MDLDLSANGAHVRMRDGRRGHSDLTGPVKTHVRKKGVKQC